MKPIDYRNETWADIQARLDLMRETVYRGYQIHGACTTRELADKMGLERDTVRPRNTELVELGYVELAYPDLPGRAGVYQAVPLAVAIARFNQKKAEALQQQLPLNL